LDNFKKIIELFTQKVVTKLSKIWVRDPRFGIRKKPIPDPGSGKNLFRIPDPEKNLSRIPDPGVKKAPDPGSLILDPGSGSATLVSKTDKKKVR
jgi:hypothetical protein